MIKAPQGKEEPQALLCSDLSAPPVQILQWFRLRWQIEVTFFEVRAYLGVETQRSWSPQAIRRTTPALVALFSIVTALAHQQQLHYSFVLPKPAWYQKSLPTFADALAPVRQQLWQMRTFQMSALEPVTVKISRDLFNTWSDLLYYAA